MRNIACTHCDALIELPEQLEPRQQVYCPRCKSFLFEQHRYGTQRCFSFSITAFVLLAIAMAFPFLTFEAGGHSRTITALEASFDLFPQDFWFVGMLVLVFMLVIPVGYLSNLILLLLARKGMFNRKIAIFCAKSLSRLLPWAMADVFIVGVLVALIKVVQHADVVIGISFWAWVGFAMFFVMSAMIANKYQIWAWIEEIDNHV